MRIKSSWFTFTHLLVGRIFHRLPAPTYQASSFLHNLYSLFQVPKDTFLAQYNRGLAPSGYDTRCQAVDKKHVLEASPTPG